MIELVRALAPFAFYGLGLFALIVIARSVYRGLKTFGEILIEYERDGFGRDD